MASLALKPTGRMARRQAVSQPQVRGACGIRTPRADVIEKQLVEVENMLMGTVQKNAQGFPPQLREILSIECFQLNQYGLLGALH